MPGAGRKGLSIDTYFDERLPRWVVSDEQKLKQILINLLNNAVKHSKAGDIMGRATVDESAGQRCTICVHDCGPGISGDDAQRIFEPFERAVDNSSTAGGAGLGLAISKRYARALGGDVWLADSSPEGSTFCFSFRYRPGVREEQTELQTAGRIEAVEPAYLPVRVLIADDRASNRRGTGMRSAGS
jgi:signal transduction histidine kinase